MARTITLTRDAICCDCGAHLPAGTPALYSRGRIYGRGQHCMETHAGGRYNTPQNAEIYAARAERNTSNYNPNWRQERAERRRAARAAAHGLVVTTSTTSTPAPVSSPELAEFLELCNG